MFVLSACTEVDNEEFYNEYTNSDYHSCPSTTNMLVVCKIQYTTDSINYYDLTDGQIFPYGLGAIQELQIIFNVPYESPGSSEMVMIVNGSNIINFGVIMQSGTNSMRYQISAANGTYVVTIPSNSALTTSSGSPIKKSKTISFSVR